jgi:hypothetical protein
MNTIRLLILAGLVLGVSCKTSTPPPHVVSPPSAVPTTILKLGTYLDERGGRLLIVRKESGGQLRVEIAAKSMTDQFVDITAAPQTTGAETLQLAGINRITGNQETLRITIQKHGQMQVERLNVPFAETVLFRRK